MAGWQRQRAVLGKVKSSNHDQLQKLVASQALPTDFGRKGHQSISDSPLTPNAFANCSAWSTEVPTTPRSTLLIKSTGSLAIPPILLETLLGGRARSAVLFLN